MNGYIKLLRTAETMEILTRPKEFVLLALIALRVRRNETFSAIGLKPGEALIGDHKKCGLSRQQYRTAKINLQKWGFITTRSTSKGTVARLTKTTVFDANIEGPNHQTNHRPTTKPTTDQPSTNHRPTTNKKEKKEKKEKTPELFSLKKRYSDHNLIDRAFSAIASTRKSNKVSDNILLAQLKKWDRYPITQVEAGIRIYLDKNYSSQGRREEYLFGIIRNASDENPQTTSQPPKIAKTTEDLEKLINGESI